MYQQKWLLTTLPHNSATKEFNNETCKGELSIYKDLPLIRDVGGTLFDVGQLNVVKDIGDAFLNALSRKSLFGKNDRISIL